MNIIFTLLLLNTFLFHFRDAIDLAVKYKDTPTDMDDQILEELDNFHFEGKKPEENED